MTFRGSVPFLVEQEIIKVSAASEDEEKMNRRVRRDRRAFSWERLKKISL